MHPYMVREVVRQRAAERQEEARKASLARAMRKAMRQRARSGAADTFVVPAIPDYVDGTFGAEEAGSGGHQVPAGRTGR